MPERVLETSDGQPLMFSRGFVTSDDGKYLAATAATTSGKYGVIRFNLKTNEITPILPQTQIYNSDAPTDPDKALSPAGRYAAVAFNSESVPDAYFKIVDINTCYSHDAPYRAGADTCKSYDYLPWLRQNIPGITKVLSIHFVNENSLTFVAQIGWGQDAQYYRFNIAPFGQQTRLLDYLAMGDSFASGEGAFNYRDGTDKSPNKCHQSLNSYPYILDGVMGATKSVACSGAKIINITGDPENKHTNQLKDTEDKDIDDGQKTLATNNFMPGILGQLDLIKENNPQAVTVSIGGNDVGFKDIIQACVTPITASMNCYELYEDRVQLVNDINSKYFNLVKTYQKLKATDPTRRVYVIGYPYIISATGYCDVNVRMSERDREFAVQLTDYLDSVIERAAAEAGVFYVDTRHALDGHKLCDSGVKAVNGLTEGDDSNLGVANESYHPNKMGQQLLADTISAQTDNLTKPMPKSKIIPATSFDDIPLLEGAPHDVSPPKRIWVKRDDGQLMFTGQDRDIYISENDTQRILRSGTVMKAEIHSLTVDVGTLTVNVTGALIGVLHIPSSVPVGFHTLHVLGRDIYGQDVDVQMSVYVAASAYDYDGDGIPNAQDACVAVPQSGLDDDHDGIDDACDPVIEEAAPSNGEQNETPPPTNEPTESNDTNEQTGEDGYVLGDTGLQTPQERVPAQSQKLFTILTNQFATDKNANTATNKSAKSSSNPQLSQAKDDAASAHATSSTDIIWIPAVLIMGCVGIGMAAALANRRR
jgi:hypothetical protein